MAGLIRRLLRNRPTGAVDLGEVGAIAAAAGSAPGDTGASPAAALARRWLAGELAGLAPARCRVLGPGRLVASDTLPFACRMEPLAAEEAVAAAAAELDCLVIGDALAATDDPLTMLRQVVNGPVAAAARRLLVVLPGTALLPDDAAPCPRRWLFSSVSGAAMASRVLGDRAGPVVVLGNVLAAASELLGVAADRLWPDELAADDPEYPMVVALTTKP